MIREEPYQGLNAPPLEVGVRKAPRGQGAAWLSSARAVRCQVKSYNERNPYRQLLAVRPSTLPGLPAQAARKEGMTSNHHGPYVLGDTRATMAGTERSDTVTLSGS